MVKIKRDKRFVWPDRYYIWTYYPEKFRKSIYITSKSKLYAKHYTCIPFFTRTHAKHVAVFYHGKVALHYIHIISGKRLIKQGITSFMIKKYRDACFIKGQVRYLRPWAYPPEYRYDKHRRRYYIIRMNRAFAQGGRKKFNEEYLRFNYGNNYRRISRAYLNKRYSRIRRSIWRGLVANPDDPDLLSTNSNIKEEWK